MKWRLHQRDAKLWQAADRFLSLGVPEATPEHEAQVREWIESDPENKSEFDAVAAAWNKLGSIEGSSPVSDTIARYNSHSIPAHRRVSPRSLLAACVLVVFAGSVAVFLHGRVQHSQNYQTRSAEQSVAVLPDGSTMHLNARSEVQVSYSNAERHIELVDGEATFRVEHDVSRPFLVIVNGVSVRALGTEFNVRRENNSITVSVLEGVVEVVGSPNELVNRHSWHEELSVGRVLKLDQSTSAVRVEVGAADIARIKGWQSGRLVFQNEPLYSVVQAVNRNTGSGRIVIVDKAISDLPVTMNFDVKQANDFVSALLLGFPIEAEYLGNGEIRLRGKSAARHGI